MLTLLAFAMITVFMALIMTKRMSVLTALILVPIVFALLGGFRAGVGPMMLDGVTALAPTAVMLLFAILFFSVMIDVGLFDPAVRHVVRLVRGDPLRILVGTSILTLLVSLDGDGSTTYLIVTSALLPLYRRLGLSRLIDVPAGWSRAGRARRPRAVHHPLEHHHVLRAVADRIGGWRHSVRRARLTGGGRHSERSTAGAEARNPWPTGRELPSR